MENEKFEFKVGDIVSMCGATGTIISTKNSLVESLKIEERYPIAVQFKERKIFFTVDGKEVEDQTEPTLKFIYRPKKKVKKTYYVASFKTKEAEGRYCTPLYLDLEILKLTYANCIDRQIHSIEIEEEV